MLRAFLSVFSFSSATGTQVTMEGNIFFIAPDGAVSGGIGWSLPVEYGDSEIDLKKKVRDFAVAQGVSSHNVVIIGL